ncbi:helix-turn-helix domain-containing protein [Maribacter sp. R86514]|uniref:helix-turn-helix domain-containing protein n=1 Tax=Maribacter sp. R86514 TaxID=3093854 RepID=UPI0037C5F7FC
MLDPTSFLTRLKTILVHNELSSAAFADLINVQRSSISHLLNGRNKPSLEFIMKVDDAFTEVDLQWLLYGKGTYPKSTQRNNVTQDTPKEPLQKVTTDKKVDRIVIFFTDGTFKTYSEI